MKQKGFTLIELLTTIFIVAVVGLVITGLISSTFLNNRGWTEERAYKGADTFIRNNALSVQRKTCAGDSDGDGYGTCALVLSDGKRVRLECPTDFWDTKIWGATSCKEKFNDIQFLTGEG